METMKKLSDITTALVVFEEAAIAQAKATEEGNYKVANKMYSIIVNAATFLKDKMNFLN